MLSELGYRTLVADLDPQANLTAAFLDEDIVADLWSSSAPTGANTIYQCIRPLTEVGDIREPNLQKISAQLSLLPGDLALAGFEENLSSEWPNSLGSGNLHRPFRVLTAFWQVLQMGAATSHAEVVVVDVGPSLGAINRSALIATDFIVVPLAADLFSLQGLRNLGPTLRRWREEWQKRKDNWKNPAFALPDGRMAPIGYVVQQHGVRLNRPTAAFDRWVRRIPAEYSESVLDTFDSLSAGMPESDPNRIATVKHYRSLVPLAQDARKPIFRLTSADGAIGAHQTAAREAYDDFRKLATEVLRRMGVKAKTPAF
jgi:cellulose biosynthesis protein BcsQ